MPVVTISCDEPGCENGLVLVEGVRGGSRSQLESPDTWWDTCPRCNGTREVQVEVDPEQEDLEC